MNTSSAPLRRLSRELLVRVAAASVVLALLATLANAWISHRDERARQREQVEAVLGAYVPSLAKSVWELDDASVQLQLDGLRSFPALLSAEVIGRGIDERYDKTGVVAAHGGEIIRHPLPAPDGLGVVAELVLQLDEDWLAGQVWRASRQFAFAALVELLLLAALVYALVARSVSRPLERLHAHVRALDAERLAEPAPRPPGPANELHALADGITGLQHALQAQLQAQARQFDEVLRQMADGAGVVDGHGRIQVCNPAWAAMLGSALPDEALGRDAADWLAEPAWPALAARLATAGTLQAEALTLRRPDGRALPAEASFAVLARGSDGRAERVQLVLRDVSARRETERTLVAAREAAEAATRAKSDFLANMSHEIRTPLNAILGMTALALRTELDTRQRDYLEKTRAAAQSLLGIVNVILDFSKIEAGRLELEHDAFDLDAVLDGVAAIVALQAHDRGLGFVLDLPASVPRGLVGDALRLSQVLVNLCGNAVKFSERGEVVVSVAAEAGPAEGRLRLRFGVHDNGIGLSQQDLERLFRPFSQVDASTTRRYGGTGLGLAISRQLVQAMGGDITVRSTPGHGSDFLFDAVFGLAPQAAAPARRAPRPGLRLLVADASARAREVLQARAAELGCLVRSAGDADEAATHAAEGADLVLMAAALAAADPGLPARLHMLAGPGLRIAVLVPYGADDAERTLPPGVDTLLATPVSAASLLALLESLFGRDAPAAGAPLPPPPSRRLDGLRVLLAEDNPVNQELTLELLRQAGASTALAGDGLEALAWLAREPFDAVLMDVQMPGLDGLETTRRLRRLPGLDTLPVIAMTAHAMASDREACLAAGMNDHLAKPFEPDALIERLRHWTRADEAPAAAPAPPAPPPPAAVLPPTLPGLDMATGLRFAAGQPALYRRVLELFAQSRAGMPAAIGEQCRGGDLAAAASALHMLKSESGTIGATALREATRTLEAAVRSGEHEAIAAALPLFETELRQVLAGLAAAFGTPAASVQASRLS
ncbi:hybrid sensor histidine kinase/response regulator [Rubrivivax gelatinosus]|uniref:hybrid sensor histidine kinase/response regulator n=1 Tax=Rubrivivax gelatinosus TaxID=28068 RepID=UPI0011D1E558|nr:response regulator [Rubrivivax gelatinosus]